jgi:hypothetical protein
MAITQVQPLTTFTDSELTAALDFLKSLCFTRGDSTTADRLKEIQNRLASGIGAVERLMYFYTLHNNLI